MDKDLNDIETSQLFNELFRRLAKSGQKAASSTVDGVANTIYSVRTSKFVKNCLENSKKFMKTRKGKIAGALIGLAMVGGGIKMFSHSEKDEAKTQNKEFYDQAMQNLAPQKIDSKKDFDKVLDKAKDLLPMTWYLHEALVKGPYSDTGKKDAPPNSQGFGIYNDPDHGMRKVLELCKNNKRYCADITDALTSYYIKSMFDWFKKQENGNFYQNMYDRLQGCEITPLQITALMSVYYNNPAKGIQAMNKFKEAGAEACASFILDMKCDPEFQNGIDHRRMIEIGLLLNSKKLLENLPRFTTRVYVDGNNVECVSAGNVSIFSKQDIAKIKEELRKRDQTTFWKKFNQFCDEGIKGNGATIAETLQKDAPLYALGVLRCLDTSTFQAFSNEIIACAAEYYTKMQDSQGMEDFAKQLEAMNIVGITPEEINLNLAAMNLRMGNIDKSIDCSVKVFEATDDPDCRLKANILMAIAHSINGNLDNAERCLEAAKKLKKKLPKDYNVSPASSSTMVAQLNPNRQI